LGRFSLIRRSKRHRYYHHAIERINYAAVRSPPFTSLRPDTHREEFVALNDVRLRDLLRAEDHDTERETVRLLAESRSVIDDVLSRYTRAHTLIVLGVPERATTTSQRLERAAGTA
jgi:hypothetical protein